MEFVTNKRFGGSSIIIKFTPKLITKRERKSEITLFSDNKIAF